MTLEEIIKYLAGELGILVTDIDRIKNILKYRYDIEVKVFPYDNGYTYGVLHEGHKVDEELRTFPSEKEAWMNGVSEGLAYAHLYLDSGIIIAIDGYPASGKGTVAKRLASELHYTYVDSGAMYRAAALYFDRTGKEITEDTVKEINIYFQRVPSGEQHTFLNHEDVEDEIRTLRIGNLASKIGLNDIVRRYLGDLQREMGSHGGIVMDGRDIGTVVFPKAQAKLYLTAGRSIRAQRRLAGYGEDSKITLEEVIKDLEDRDWRDIEQFADKRKASDAFVLDTSLLTEEDQFREALEYCKPIIEKHRLRWYRMPYK